MNLPSDDAQNQTGIPADLLRGCNVVWNSPSEDAFGSMPVGNGDIGVLAKNVHPSVAWRFLGQKSRTTVSIL